jgi:hypothetical protein
MDLFQTDIKQFTDNVVKQRTEYISQYGEKSLQQLRTRNKTSSLLKQRDIDFSLKPDELGKLLNEKLWFYPENRFENGKISSFAHFYLKAYENDMPVYVTVDSVLHAFHKTFNNVMAFIEVDKLAQNVLELLKNSLNFIHNMKSSIVDKTEQSLKLLSKLRETEKYLLVGYELFFQKLVYDENGYMSSKNKADEVAFCFIRELTKDQKHKLQYTPDNKTMLEVTELLNAIESKKAQKIMLFGRQKRVDFSQMIPRGWYCQNQILSNYFQCVMWFSLVKFHVKTEIETIWTIAFLLSKKIKDDDPNYLQLWLNANKYISGNRSKYDFVKINDAGMTLGIKEILLTSEQKIQLISKLETLDDYCSSMNFLKTVRYSNKEEMKNEHDPELLEEYDETNRIGLIPQSMTVDTWFMYEVTGSDFNHPRRIISSEDIVYAIFNNEDPKNTIISRMKGQNPDKMKFRDEIDYLKQLEEAKSKIKSSMETNPEDWRTDIYHHWLLLISKVADRRFYPKDLVYDSKAWKNKQTMAQKSSYTELRHDMTLSVEQAQLLEYMCSHPEVYIEPNLEFWTEMQLLIKNMMKTIDNLTDTTEFFSLQKAENSEKIEEIYNYDYARYGLKQFGEGLSVVNKAVRAQLDGKSFYDLEEENFAEKIKGITYFFYDSYCQLAFDGWYCKMLWDYPLVDKFNFKPEVADIFTDHPDPILGDSGCVLHIGTKLPKVGVILIKDPKLKQEKAFLICTYNATEMYSPFGTRLTDKLWSEKQKIQDQVVLETDFHKMYMWNEEDEGEEVAEGENPNEEES